MQHAATNLYSQIIVKLREFPKKPSSISINVLMNYIDKNFVSSNFG